MVDFDPILDQIERERLDVLDSINIGDRIKFLAPTRYSSRPAWRVVVGFSRLGNPLVRFQGHPEFVVRWDEVQDIETR